MPEPKTIYCSKCGRKVATWNKRSTINISVRCKKCDKLVVYDVENEKSGNVIKRAGMTFEGILRKAGKNNYHSRYDVAQYSILDEEINID